MRGALDRSQPALGRHRIEGKVNQLLARFNLIDEPWISCVPRAGGDPVLLSLRETLLSAQDQREVLDNSPLVVVALHRLLLAVLHRVLGGPGSVEEWKALYAANRFDADAIGEYLSVWRYRFDLFDPVVPFYQVPPIWDGDRLVGAVSVAKLAHERASGNNITLFDHTTKATAAFTPAQAARYLIAFQAFAVGGGVSAPFNLSDAPLARDYTVLVRGETLFETLMLNLVGYDQERPIPWLRADDPPWWERTEQPIPDRNGTPPAGYLDYLTWQSRRVHLIYDERSGLIRECQIRQNLKLATSDWLDPFKAYHVSDQSGRSSRRFREERAIWRDSQSLLRFATDAQGQESNHPPSVFEWLASALLSGMGRNMKMRLCAFDVLGFLNDGAQATVILWRHERLPLPLNYLNDRALHDKLADALALAEAVSKLFKPIYSGGKKSYPRPMRVLAEELLRGMADRKPDGSDIERLVKHLGAERDYWAALDPHFRHFMVDLAAKMAVDGVEGGRIAFAAWAKDVSTCARRAFHAAIDSLDTSGRSFRAQALAERAFNWQLHDLLPQPEKAPQEVTV